jgi:hypothetical protein
MKPNERISLDEAKRKLASKVMSLPDVVGVAVGGNEALYILLKRSYPSILSILPKIFEGYEVRFQVVGELKAL